MSRSPWMDLPEQPSYAPLNEDFRVDVCIVGGGIAGLTTAYMLMQTDRSVLLLEDGRIGGGETSRSTAHLVSMLDDRFSTLERIHGEEGARLAARSHAQAVSQIEAIVRRHRIDCDFERLDGHLFLEATHDREFIETELAACRRAGLTDARIDRRAPFRNVDGGPCIVVPDQAQFHPMKYLVRLAALVEEQGGRICEGTHVQEIEPGSPAIVKTADGRVIRAGSVVIATNAPITSRVRIPLKQYPYRTYVVALAVPRASVRKALYWDTGDPYHYARVQSGEDSSQTDLFIVGGEDHKTGQDNVGADERWRRLEEWARRRAPRAGAVVNRWSGQVMETADGLAFIGRDPSAPNCMFIATGDSGNGMTHGTIAGMLIRDLIIGRKNRWEQLYDPSRVSLRSIPEVARENLKMVTEYGKWLTRGDVGKPESVPAGEGCVLRRGFKKVACYRDPNGILHVMSATCPHLGGIVVWNSAEKTWDCPCHGSRFNARGEVVNGPANDPLTPVELKRKRRRSEKKLEKKPKRPPSTILPL